MATILTACNGGSGGSSGQVPTPAPPSTLAVKGETRMMRGMDPVPLLHPAQKVTAVYSFDTHGSRIDYAEGIDWQLTATGLARTFNSRIPDFNSYTFVMRPDGRFDFDASEPRNPPLTINYNVYIDYTATIEDRLIRATPARPSITKILCLGDSITAGAHTIASFYQDRDGDSYCGLLRKQLGIPASNEGIPGISLGSVSPNLDTYLAEEPDVVVLAFGMNDHTAGAASLPAFKQLVDQAIRNIKARRSSVIVVGFFQRNALYALEDPLETLAYNDALRAIAQANDVPFEDINEAFMKASPAPEPYFHLTADFLHHPNNYGQRIYFSTLLPHLIQQDTRASAVPDYVVLH